MNREDIIDKLFKIDCIKFGKFTLKSGIVSPIYLDLRMISSYPALSEAIIRKLINYTKHVGLTFNRVTGLAYAALPWGSYFSMIADVPLIYARKERKGYGTKKMIEGVYKSFDTVLIIDDLITKGTSKFEAIEVFESEGLQVKDILVLVDRCQGGKKSLSDKGYKLHSLITIHEIMDIAKKSQIVTIEMYDKVIKFLKETS